MGIVWKCRTKMWFFFLIFLFLSVYACTIVFQRQMRYWLLKIRWHASMCLTWLELSHWVLRFRRRKVSCLQLVLRTCIKQYIYIYIYLIRYYDWEGGCAWLEEWKSGRIENGGRIEKILISLIFVWLKVKKWRDGKNEFV